MNKLEFGFSNLAEKANRAIVIACLARLSVTVNAAPGYVGQGKIKTMQNAYGT